MKHFFTKVILLNFFWLQSSFAGNNNFDCEGTPWKWSRDISKSEMYSVLSQTNRQKLISMAFYEMNHASHEPVALPLSLYLANTEMDSKKRGFWKTMAIILVQGKSPELVYEKWPSQRGRSKIPMKMTEVCKLYNKTN